MPLKPMMHNAKTPPAGAIFVVMGEERDPVWHYPGAILDNVYIRGGVNQVGDNWLELINLHAMHEIIADQVLACEALSAAAFKFIRKELLLTCADVAAMAGEQLLALVAWESGEGFRNPAAEAKLRELYIGYRKSRVRPIPAHRQPKVA